MAWKDGFVIEYTASGDEPHKRRRSCARCVHYQGGDKCAVKGKLHPDVGLKSWRYCGRFSEKRQSPLEHKKAAKKKCGKGKTPPPGMEKDWLKPSCGRASRESLAVRNPKLAELWDYKRNDNRIAPGTISASSTQIFWWVCPKCGGSFRAEMQYMKKDANPCPYCRGKKLRRGFNDLETVVPPLAAEWHSIKNKRPPSEALYKDGNWRAWWECSKCGHVWRQSIVERVTSYAKAKQVEDCPKCGAHRVE